MAYSILIVDDNAVIRRTLRTCFLQEPECYVCGEAVDGREAIERARQLKPDLIILDLSMPNMNGLEAARELKRLVPSARLLMFTSFKTSTLEREATAAGCAAVVNKSDLQLLFDSVQRLLAAKI